jgi:hypothetical protein
MSWKRDRDSLIAQTMAFVQSVAGRTENTGRADFEPAPSRAELTALEALEEDLVPKSKRPVLEPARVAPAPPSLHATPIAASTLQREVANEIRARIASFRQHQERFSREREQYFSETLARLRATLKDTPPPRLEK